MNKKKSLYMFMIKRKNMLIISIVYMSLFFSSVEFFKCFFTVLQIQQTKSSTVFCNLDLEVSSEMLGLYAAQRKSSPLTVLPGDDEKNIVLPPKRSNLPIYPKEVYLTFDDGPTRKNTPAILEILKQYGVKASFFIIGDLAEVNSDILKRMSEEGMTILPHSYSHNYNIYNSMGAYFQDLEKCTAVLQGITGKEVPPFIRMPGGSDNAVAPKGELIKIKKSLREQEIRYVDWNISSLDASANTVDKNLIVNSVMDKCKTKKLAVVLMHDANTKTTTVEALSEIIRYLKENGFVFRTFEDLTYEEEKEMIKKKIIYK